MENARLSNLPFFNFLMHSILLKTYAPLPFALTVKYKLISSLNFSDESVLESMQTGIYKPLSGMTTAFTSSLLGLAGSLIIGFLGLQVQIAQNTIFRILSDHLSARTTVSAADEIARVLPRINLATHELTKSVQTLEQTLSDV